MMAQPSVHVSAEPSFFVIDPQFIASQQLEVTVEKYPCKYLVITDNHHKILFKVKPHDSSLHRQRLMLDADDKPIVTLREKNLSMHKRWEAYTGDNKDGSSKIIFSTKTEDLIQFKTCVSVILSNELSSNDDCVFKMEGSWKKKNFTIEDSSKKKIAQMHKPETMEKMKSGEDKFMVMIQPNMDYAFVVALVAIFDAMKNSDKKKRKAAGHVVNFISGGLIPPMN